MNRILMSFMTNGKTIEVSGLTLSLPSKEALIALAGGLLVLQILFLIGWLALALVTVALFTAQIGRISHQVEKNFWASFWWGVLGAIFICPITVMLAVSLIGIPLIPIFALLLVCAFIASYVAVAQLVGKKVLALIRKSNRPIITEELVGIILLALICLIPIAGWLFIALAVTAGFGAVITTKFGQG